MTELIVLKDLTPQIFLDNKGLEAVLEKIKKHVDEFKPDMTTEKGRGEIRSLAFKIAKSRTGLDELGKELVSEWKKKAKVIDEERSRVRKTLEEWQETVRKPLTEWEEAEKNRVENHKNNIQEIINAGTFTPDDLPIELMEERVREIEKDRNLDWQEFSDIAKEAIEKSIMQIKAAIEKRKVAEAERAELEKLRKAQEERERLDREEQIKKEAAEKAKRESEAAVKEAQDRAEKAEKLRQEIELNSKLEKDLAVKKERERIEQETRDKAAADAIREADKKHQIKIHNEIIKALGLININEEQAKILITAIRKEAIPHMKVIY